MIPDDDALIAMLLGDTKAPLALRRWLATGAGRRHLAASRRALALLDILHADVEARPAVYWHALAAPFGRVQVAVGDAGVLRIGFGRSDTAFVAELRRSLGADVIHSAERTRAARQQLRAYFAGERRAFDLPVDLARLSGFQRRVLAATARIPAGRVMSYGDIARRIGRPGGSRAVGQALGSNPVPIVIPCHRVVAAGGRIGGYAGGLRIKRTLLRIEGALAAVA